MKRSRALLATLNAPIQNAPIQNTPIQNPSSKTQKMMDSLKLHQPPQASDKEVAPRPAATELAKPLSIEKQFQGSEKDCIAWSMSNVLTRAFAMKLCLTSTKHQCVDWKLNYGENNCKQYIKEMILVGDDDDDADDEKLSESDNAIYYRYCRIYHFFQKTIREIMSRVGNNIDNISRELELDNIAKYTKFPETFTPMTVFRTLHSKDGGINGLDLIKVKEYLDQGYYAVISIKYDEKWLSTFRKYTPRMDIGELLESDVLVPEFKSTGHAMVLKNISHDGRFYIKNSWGPQWGNNGEIVLTPDHLQSYRITVFHFPSIHGRGLNKKVKKSKKVKSKKIKKSKKTKSKKAKK
jgi:hypothetical protein